MRSLLLVAPDDDAALARATASGADALVLDLADRDRDTCRRALATLGSTQMARSFVRVRLTTEITATLDVVMPARPRGVLLAGTTGGADVTRLSALLRPREALAGIADGATRIVAMASDTPRSLLAAASYAGASECLIGLAWDIDALSRALAVHDTGDLARHARTTVLLAAAAAGVAAVDRPYDGNDVKLLEEEAQAARATGFTGKLAVHADQVPVINAVFSRRAASSS